MTLCPSKGWTIALTAGLGLSLACSDPETTQIPPPSPETPQDTPRFSAGPDANPAPGRRVLAQTVSGLTSDEALVRGSPTPVALTPPPSAGLTGPLDYGFERSDLGRTGLFWEVRGADRAVLFTVRDGAVTAVRTRTDGVGWAPPSVRHGYDAHHVMPRTVSPSGTWEAWWHGGAIHTLRFEDEAAAEHTLQGVLGDEVTLVRSSSEDAVVAFAAHADGWHRWRIPAADAPEDLGVVAALDEPWMVAFDRLVPPPDPLESGQLFYPAPNRALVADARDLGRLVDLETDAILATGIPMPRERPDRRWYAACGAETDGVDVWDLVTGERRRVALAGVCPTGEVGARLAGQVDPSGERLVVQREWTLIDVDLERDTRTERELERGPSLFAVIDGGGVVLVSGTAQAWLPPGESTPLDLEMRSWPVRRGFAFVTADLPALQLERWSFGAEPDVVTLPGQAPPALLPLPAGDGLVHLRTGGPEAVFLDDAFELRYPALSDWPRADRDPIGAADGGVWFAETRRDPALLFLPLDGGPAERLPVAADLRLRFAYWPERRAVVLETPSGLVACTAVDGRIRNVPFGRGKLAIDGFAALDFDGRHVLPTYLDPGRRARVVEGPRDVWVVRDETLVRLAPEGGAAGAFPLPGVEQAVVFEVGARVLVVAGPPDALRFWSLPRLEPEAGFELTGEAAAIVGRWYLGGGGQIPLDAAGRALEARGDHMMAFGPAGPTELFRHDGHAITSWMVADGGWVAITEGPEGSTAWLEGADGVTSWALLSVPGAFRLYRASDGVVVAHSALADVLVELEEGRVTRLPREVRALGEAIGPVRFLGADRWQDGLRVYDVANDTWTPLDDSLGRMLWDAVVLP